MPIRIGDILELDGMNYIVTELLENDCKVVGFSLKYSRIFQGDEHYVNYHDIFEKNVVGSIYE